MKTRCLEAARTFGMMLAILAAASGPCLGAEKQDPKAELRDNMLSTYGDAYALWELVGGVERVYENLGTTADKDVWRELTVITYFLEFAKETRKSIEDQIREMNTSAMPDACAHESALKLLEELRSNTTKQTEVLKKARKYLEVLQKKLSDSPLVVSHGYGPITRLEELDVSKLIPAAEKLVSKTKP